MSYYEIKHSGIKGQKWGIRRYQNPDGTLTPEGKIRYGGKYGKVRHEIDKGADPRLATMKARQEKNAAAAKTAIKGAGVGIGGSLLGQALMVLGAATVNMPVSVLGGMIASGTGMGSTVLLGKAAIDAGYGKVKLDEIEREYNLRS